MAEFLTVNVYVPGRSMLQNTPSSSTVADNGCSSWSEIIPILLASYCMSYIGQCLYTQVGECRQPCHLKVTKVTVLCVHTCVHKMLTYIQVYM